MATSTNSVVSSEMRYLSPGGKVLAATSSSSSSDVLYGLNGIGARELIDDQHGGGDAVLAAEAGIAFAGEFGARRHPSSAGSSRPAACGRSCSRIRQAPSGGP